MAAEQQLIQRQELTTYYDVSKNFDETRLNAHIMRAQRNDVQHVLGAELYYDMMQDLNAVKYQLLLNGGTYDKQSRTIYFQGVNELLASFAYSRVLGNNDTFVGNKGNKIKLSDESTEQTKVEVNVKAREAYSEALNIADSLKGFLEDNPDDYPLYRIGDRRPPEQSFIFIKV